MRELKSTTLMTLSKVVGLQTSMSCNNEIRSRSSPLNGTTPLTEQLVRSAVVEKSDFDLIIFNEPCSASKGKHPKITV